MTSALDYFTCLPKYRVALCKICHYCVWPDNARTHLREKHSRLPKAERALICEELQAWQEVSHSHEHFEIPQAVDQPIQGLRLFQDGKQCELDPEQCTLICRLMQSLVVRSTSCKVRESSLHRGSARATVSPTAGVLTPRDSFSRLIGAFPYARHSKHGNKASMVVEEIL